MIKKIVKIVDKEGMRIRRRHLISHIAQSYESNIFIEYNENENYSGSINVKSLLGMMSLPAYSGMEFMIVIKGKDENEAAEAMIRFFGMEFEEICEIFYNMFEKEEDEKYQKEWEQRKKFDKVIVKEIFKGNPSKDEIIKNYAEIDIRTIYDEETLMNAFHYFRSMSVEEAKLNHLLLEEVDKDKPSKKTIKDLLDKGANINTQDIFGESVLMNAVDNLQHLTYKNNGERTEDTVRELDIDLIQFLIDQGADVNHNSRNHYCLITAALGIVRDDLVEMLLKAGAKINVVCGGDWDEPGPYHNSIFDFVVDVYNKTEDDNRKAELKKIIEIFKKYGAKS